MNQMLGAELIGGDQDHAPIRGYGDGSRHERSLPRAQRARDRGHPGLVGMSKRMLDVYDMVTRVAPTASTVGGGTRRAQWRSI